MTNMELCQHGKHRSSLTCIGIERYSQHGDDAFVTKCTLNITMCKHSVTECSTARNYVTARAGRCQDSANNLCPHKKITPKKQKCMPKSIQHWNKHMQLLQHGNHE